MPKKEANLLANIKWPSRLEKRFLDEVQFCFDGTHSQLLVNWQHRCGDPAQLYRYSPPWDSTPDIIPIPGSRISNPVLSKTGKWLAFSDGGRLKLIDWQGERRLLDFSIKDFTPEGFSDDETLLLCRGANACKVLSLGALQVLKEINITARHGYLRAFHPSNDWLVGTTDTKLAAYSLKTNAFEKLYFSEASWIVRQHYRKS